MLSFVKFSTGCVCNGALIAHTQDYNRVPGSHDVALCFVHRVV